SSWLYEVKPARSHKFGFRICFVLRASDLEFNLFEGGDSLVRIHSPDPGFLLHLVRVRSG
ncbi:MAG: hypothetical protein WBH36_14770, partial [Syntrophobacteria bacterium]